MQLREPRERSNSEEAGAFLKKISEFHAGACDSDAGILEDV